MQYTEEQQRAIDARGTDLLLSAAAGSGKTAVLVQRVLSLIEEGADVRRMLVVTFTRAAAAEMRERLASRLSEAAAQGDRRLREQMLCLDRASITTLHGFCADFLRANFEAALVDPAFRILDDAEDARLLDEAADEAMDALYEEGGEALARLDAGRGPEKVRTLALRLYAFLGERPDPEAWLSSALDRAQAPVAAWMEELARAARRALEAALAATRAAHDHPGCPPHYAAALEKDEEALLELCKIGKAEELAARLHGFKQAKPSGRNRDVDPDALDAVKALRKFAGDAVKRCSLYDLPLERAREDALQLYDVYPVLAEAARRIGEEHARRKEERGGLSYADLERCALRALMREEVRKSVREQYDYVFVDEYQDVSDLQEALITAVSRGDNLFAVGDVKQSIYRFRLAEPRLFLDRYQRYLRGDGGQLLPLTRNFRSTRTVIDFVNAVFSRTMTGGDSEIVYDDLARLHAGLEDTEDAPLPEIHILDEAAGNETADEALEEIGRAGREAMWIAGRIRQLRAEDPELRYRDIAILTRAKSSAAAAMLPVLLAEGIPAYAEGLSGYFDTLEVAFVLSLLRLVDNELEDVEMIGALRSCMARLTLEELSQIRLAHPELSFADAARACAGEGEGALAEKLRAFFALLDSWQLRAGTLPLGELVRAVSVESGFYAYAGALPGGAQRQANLDALATRAENFDAAVSGSLTRFLAYAEHMRARGDGDSAHLLGEGRRRCAPDDHSQEQGAGISRRLRRAHGAQFSRRHGRRTLPCPPRAGVERPLCGSGAAHAARAAFLRRHRRTRAPRGRRRGTAPSLRAAHARQAQALPRRQFAFRNRAPAALRGHGDLPHRRRQPLAADARGRWKRRSAPGKRRWRLSPFTAWTSFPRPRRNSHARRRQTRSTPRSGRRGKRTRPWPGSIPIAWTARVPSSSQPPAFCARRKGRANCRRWPNGRSSCRKRA